MFSNKRNIALGVVALVIAALSGIAWHARQTGTSVSQSFGAAGQYAYPVGPGQINGQAAGNFPNLVLDAGPLAPLNAVVTIGPDAGDGGAVTYVMLAQDRTANLDTSAGLLATAVLGNATGRECHTFRWWNWNDAQVPPLVTSDAGMVGFAGQSTGGSAGLVDASVINTPGAPYTLCADGVEWVTP